MAHHYSNSLYDRLADRLNQFPQGAPLSDSLFAILKILFSEKEAGLVAQLPIKPFTVDRAAAIWKLDKATAQNMLEDLAGRAMLLDMEQNGQQMFCLPPPMAGFFEFSMMRVRGDVDARRDNSASSGMITSTKSELQIPQENYNGGEVPRLLLCLQLSRCECRFPRRYTFVLWSGSGSPSCGQPCHRFGE